VRCFRVVSRMLMIYRPGTMRTQALE
jgi:hypothetical protein